MSANGHAARGGIDLGGTKIQAVVVDGAHHVLGSARRPTPVKGGPPAIAAEMASVLLDAVADAGIAQPELGGVGVGSPGAVNEAAGTVARAGNLSGWEDPFPLGHELEAALGCPVTLGNDVQVATDAEFALGAGRRYDSLLGVFWGTGVGGGLVLDRRPWVGRGAAGEIGHIVVNRHGAQCPCGRRGCLEAYAGRGPMEQRAREAHAEGRKTNLFTIMAERGQTRLTSGVWARAVEQGDRLALHLLDRAIKALGTGIASAMNLLDVEAVILGGGMGQRFGVSHLAEIQAEMAGHLFVRERPPAVHVAALGDLGGAVGAALLAAR